MRRARTPRSAATAGEAPVSVTSPAPRDVWSELVEADADALVTQTPDWTTCACRILDARDVSRLYEFADGRMVLPLVGARRRPGMTASFPPAWGFGGLVGARPTAGQVREIFDDLRAANRLSVRVRPNPLHDAVWSAGAPRDVVRLPRRAHVIDLTAGFDGVWSQGFSSRARNHVRRAERSGVHVEQDANGRLVPVFLDLFRQSVDRWARRQHEPRALARWRAVRRDPPAKLSRLAHDFGDRSRLWVAWAADGRPAAAILVLQGSNAHYTRGVMDVDVAGPTRANYLLHRLAIEDACRAGCRSYHMGETGSSASLAQFKEAVGGRPHRYSEYVAEALPFTEIDRRARGAAKWALRFRDAG